MSISNEERLIFAYLLQMLLQWIDLSTDSLKSISDIYSNLEDSEWVLRESHPEQDNVEKIRYPPTILFIRLPGKALMYISLFSRIGFEDFFWIFLSALLPRWLPGLDYGNQ